MRFISTVLLLVTLCCVSKHYKQSYLACWCLLCLVTVYRGEDRLGGAKLAYIDTSVSLQVVDSTKDLVPSYGCQKIHTAYI